jgi:hypothetical protein
MRGESRRYPQVWDKAICHGVSRASPRPSPDELDIRVLTLRYPRAQDSVISTVPVLPVAYSKVSMSVGECDLAEHCLMLLPPLW